MNPVEISSRRRFLLGALSGAGALVLSGCDKLASTAWFQKTLGAGESLTRVAQRWVDSAQGDGAGIQRCGLVAAVPQQRHGGPAQRAISGAGDGRIRRVSARGRRPGRDARRVCRSPTCARCRAARR